jgi:hypothetical protein
MRHKWSVLAFVLLAVTSQHARADFVANYVFDTANAANLGAAPYGNLTVTGNSAAKTVTFSLTTAANANAQFSDLAFNFANIPSADMSLVPLSGYALNIAPPPINYDGFGNFSAEVAPASQNTRVSTLTFTLKLATSSEVAAANFQTLNSGAGNPPGSFYFAAHYFPGNGNTGYIGVSPNGGPNPGPNGNPVPAPSAVLLLGTGGIAFVGMLLRTRRKVLAIS